MKPHKLVVISLDSTGFRDLDEWIDPAPPLESYSGPGHLGSTRAGNLPDVDLSVPYFHHYRAIPGSSWHY